MKPRFDRIYTDWWREQLVKCGLTKRKATALVAAWNRKLNKLLKEQYPAQR